MCVLIRYLSELCCVDGIGGVGRAAFPVVRHTLSSHTLNTSVRDISFEEESEDTAFSSEVLLAGVCCRSAVVFVLLAV